MNNVTAKGCSYLSKASWLNLKEINLGKNYREYEGWNKINTEGFSCLRKAYRANLRTICLSK